MDDDHQVFFAKKIVAIRSVCVCDNHMTIKQKIFCCCFSRQKEIILNDDDDDKREKWR